KPDTVDDRRMVEAVGYDRIRFAEQRLEQAAIGIEGGGEDDRILEAEIGGDRRFELAVYFLRPADEANRSQSGTPPPRRIDCGVDHALIGSETEIIIGAKVDRRGGAARERHSGALRRRDDPLGLP